MIVVSYPANNGSWKVKVKNIQYYKILLIEQFEVIPLSTHFNGIIPYDECFQLANTFLESKINIK